jgi:hypothetical protein
MSRPALGPTQPSIIWVLGFYPRVKQPGLEANHSLLFSAKVKNAWGYTSAPPLSSWHGAWLSNVYSFVAWYLFKHKDNSIFTFTFFNNIHEIWLWSSRNYFIASMTLYLELTERGCLWSTPLEQLCTEPSDVATVGNIFGTLVKWLSVPLSPFFFPVCLQYPELFILLRQTLFLETEVMFHLQW